MKKFELLRYLKKFSILIFLVALLGSVGIYWYADNNQKYTAYAIIRKHHPRTEPRRDEV